LVVKSPKTNSGNLTIPLPDWLVDQFAELLAAGAEATGVKPEKIDRILLSPTGKPLVDHTV
jgi:hypothetical protein